jgi:hypothetical protein
VRLSAPSLESKEGVTFGGASVNAQGEWRPQVIEMAPSKSNRCDVHVPASSAVVVRLLG